MTLSTSESKTFTEAWPPLPFAEWQPTCETLHMWTQIVGKIRLALTPPINHWWHVPLYITARGLTTSAIPYPQDQSKSFEITFDLLDHDLSILTSEGTSKTLPLISRSVANFYEELMTSLNSLGIEVTINPVPCELEKPIPFDQDHLHCSYDPVYANRFWRILTQTEQVLRRYRSPFLGKSSPIHFFWGSFDLALSFFSGRPAPARPGADRITREAYSHEVISCGFWPGNERFPTPAFYSYVVPAPQGLEKLPVRPAAASYNAELGEFLLPYDDVRNAKQPEQTLWQFFQSAYEGYAGLAGWDRKALEKQ
jgi:Family of unknown function (DUF5996)